MGRSIPHDQYMRLRDLQQRNLDCRHSTASGASCRKRARFTVQETVTDRNPKGGTFAPQTNGMRYCYTHWRTVLTMLAAHGVVVDGTDVTTVHPDTGQVCVYHMGTVRDLADAQ